MREEKSHKKKINFKIQIKKEAEAITEHSLAFEQAL